MFTWGGVVVDALNRKVKNDFTQLYYATIFEIFIVLLS